MKEIRFECDEHKNSINKRKHGVSFEDAATVFFDDYARLYTDVAHSLEEERYLLLGLMERAVCVVVCHCYCNEDAIIRIISARKATKSERNEYYKLRREAERNERGI